MESYAPVKVVSMELVPYLLLPTFVDHNSYLSGIDTDVDVTFILLSTIIVI